MKPLMFMIALLALILSPAHGQSISIPGPTTVNARENTSAQFRVQVNNAPAGWSIGAAVIYNADASPSDVGPGSPSQTAIGPATVDVAIPINVGGGNESDEAFSVQVTLRNASGATLDIETRAVNIMGTSGLVTGDANRDGVFNNFDIVQILSQGKYLTGLPAGWWQGDFNGDGVFNQLDVILIAG